MNPIRKYIKEREPLYDEIEKIRKNIYNLEKKANKFTDFSKLKLRKAKPADITVGNIIYYPREDDSYWQIIDTVRYPDDDFKAYCSEDGCRYGLHNAYVEVPE